MSTQIEVIRNEEPLYLEGLVCDGSTCVFHNQQSPHPGEDYYLVDLSAHCDCGKRFKDHDLLGVAIAMVE